MGALGSWTPGPHASLPTRATLMGGSFGGLNFQCWFRDGFDDNFTDAVSVTFL